MSRNWQACKGMIEVQSCLDRLAWHCHQVFYKQLKAWWVLPSLLSKAAHVSFTSGEASTHPKSPSLIYPPSAKGTCFGGRWGKGGGRYVPGLLKSRVADEQGSNLPPPPTTPHHTPEQLTTQSLNVRVVNGLLVDQSSEFLVQASMLPEAALPRAAGLRGLRAEEASIALEWHRGFEVIPLTGQDQILLAALAPH